MKYKCAHVDRIYIFYAIRGRGRYIVVGVFILICCGAQLLFYILRAKINVLGGKDVL